MGTCQGRRSWREVGTWEGTEGRGQRPRPRLRQQEPSESPGASPQQRFPRGWPCSSSKEGTAVSPSKPWGEQGPSAGQTRPQPRAPSRSCLCHVPAAPEPASRTRASASPSVPSVAGRGVPASWHRREDGVTGRSSGKGGHLLSESRRSALETRPAGVTGALGRSQTLPACPSPGHGAGTNSAHWAGAEADAEGTGDVGTLQRRHSRGDALTDTIRR